MIIISLKYLAEDCFWLTDIVLFHIIIAKRFNFYYIHLIII